MGKKRFILDITFEGWQYGTYDPRAKSISSKAINSILPDLDGNNWLTDYLNDYRKRLKEGSKI